MHCTEAERPGPDGERQRFVWIRARIPARACLCSCSSAPARPRGTFAPEHSSPGQPRPPGAGKAAATARVREALPGARDWKWDVTKGEDLGFLPARILQTYDRCAALSAPGKRREENE